eukprot:g13184.t1 g13184   contig8:102567-104315(+)
MRLNQATPILLGLATVPSANANRESPMTTARNDFATKLIVGLHELKEHSKAHPSRELQVDDASFITANEELQCPDTCTSQETCDYFQATFYEENNSTAFLEEACNAGFISECAPVSFETTCDMICMETDLGLVDDFTGDLICAFCNFVDCCGSEGNGDSCLGMYADALGIDAPELDDFKDDDEDNSGADNAFIGTDDGGALPTNSLTQRPTFDFSTDDIWSEECPETCTSQETCDYFQGNIYEENNSTAFLEEACNAGFLSECAPVSFETTCDLVCMETDLGLVDDFTGDLICAFCNFVDCCGSEGNGDSCLGMYADALGIDAPELDDFKDDDGDNSGADNAFIGTDDGGALPTNSPTHVPTNFPTNFPTNSPSELQVDDASFITANEELQCPDTCTSQETCDYFQATFYEENNSTAFLEEACNAGFISECAPVSFETTCDMICMETDLGLVDDFTGDLICAFCNFVDCCGSEGNGDSCLGMYADALGIDAPELDDFKDDDEDNSGADNAFIGTDDGGALPTNSPTHVPTSGNVTDAPSASPSLGLTEEEPSAARSSASFSVESGLAGVILGSVVLAVGFGF